MNCINASLCRRNDFAGNSRPNTAIQNETLVTDSSTEKKFLAISTNRRYILVIVNAPSVISPCLSGNVRNNTGMTKIALITGITGQDGAYLARLLLSKEYIVHGILRRSSSSNTSRIEKLIPNDTDRLHLHFGDMTDAVGLAKILHETQPDEVYNLAALSHVKVSFDMPEYTGNVNALGVIRILEVLRELGLAETTRFYQASTSELYGGLSLEPYNAGSVF